MGGDSPLASKEPCVLYVAEEADGVADAWTGAERPFEVLPARPADAIDRFADARIACVVCHSDGSHGVGAVVEAVREANDAVPIVVLSTGEGVSRATAMENGATYVDLDRDFDPIERLEDVAPVVERHRVAMRDRTMLDSLLEQIPLSVYWKDRRSRHVRVSDAMLSMIGPDYLENPEGKRFHAPEDVVGNTDFDLYPDELAESATADDRRVVESESPIVDRIEHSFGSPDHGTYVATSKAPWYDDQGRVIGLVGITRDVSERMQYERQLERQNDRLEQFAQVLSHDLRNPLEVARGRLELARDGGDPEEHFAAMDRALARMDSLIEDVLTLARDGDVVVEPEPVDLAAAAEAAWAVVDADDAELVVETDAEVLADPGRLQQILENLFRNAVEHGRPGDGHREGASDTDDGTAPGPITVTVGELPSRGFYVADDGRGVPAEVREEVFETGVTAGDSGTGLGLGIVRTIAEVHGWQVDLAESDGGGARFEFTGVRWPS